jgi:hypothetical protein
MSDRSATLRFISKRLGQRDLVWAGLRADDIEAISDLPQLAESFSIVGGHDRGGAVPSTDFEDLAGERADLDRWDIDDHLDSPPAIEFRENILRRLAKPTALLPYRPSRFLSSILFARKDRCIDLGLFGAHQAIFEHKPWLESIVAGLNLPRINWTYVADEEQTRVKRLLADGPVMLRLSKSSGGTGFIRVDDPESLTASWPHRAEAFVSVTRFLDDVTPINIGATVWHDGVTMHHPSVQLIGIPTCTTRPFGYCGNDFALAGELGRRELATIEESVRAVGHLLRGYGYLGTFGVDFMVHEGTPLFTEINPRFQGSTHASSQLSGEAGASCVILDHVAAILGGDAPTQRPLHELAREIPPFSHFVIHWTGDPTTMDASPLVHTLREHPTHSRTDVMTKPHIITRTEGVVARVTLRTGITRTGFDLADPWSNILARWIGEMSAEPAPLGG